MSEPHQADTTDLKDAGQDHRPALALAVSCLLHLLVAALLIVELPRSMTPPESEQPVMVDLVPPEKAEPPPKPQPKEDKAERMPKSPETAPPPRPRAIEPAFQFGQKDAGPRKSPEGNSAKDGAATKTPPANADGGDLSQPPVEKAAQAAVKVPPPAKDDEAALKMVENTPATPNLKEARKLFSQTASGDLTATTAMAGVPRPARAGRLCVSEMRAQLLNLAAPYFPDILPSGSPGEGTIIDIVDAAFRAERKWYGLSYRCQVDAEATRVVSFAFRVGEPIPRGEWSRRGLPSQ